MYLVALKDNALALGGDVPAAHGHVIAAGEDLELVAAEPHHVRRPADETGNRAGKGERLVFMGAGCWLRLWLRGEAPVVAFATPHAQLKRRPPATDRPTLYVPRSGGGRHGRWRPAAGRGPRRLPPATGARRCES